MQGLTDVPVKTYLFRLEFNTLEEAIRVAEQEDFSVKQAHANPIVHRDDRKMEAQNQWTSVTRGARALVLNNYKKLQKCNRCQKTGYYAYECGALRAVPRTAGNSNLQAAKRGPRRGSDVVAFSQHCNGQPKNGQGQ